MQIHWFSIINSCVTVLLLTGFLATILMRVLKNDFLKYSRDDDGASAACFSLEDAHLLRGAVMYNNGDFNSRTGLFCCQVTSSMPVRDDSSEWEVVALRRRGRQE